MPVISFIEHYQRSIKKNEDDESRLLHCLEKLSNLTVKVSDLEATGIGRTVNSLRKKPGKVGDTARALVNSWMKLVENTVEDDDQSGDEMQTKENGYAENSHDEEGTPSPENYSQKYNNGLDETVKIKEEKSKSRHSHKEKKSVKEEPGSKRSHSERKKEDSKVEESRHHRKHSDSSHKSRSKERKDSESRSKSKRGHEEKKIKTEPQEIDGYDPTDYEGLKIKEERLSPADYCKYNPEVPVKIKKEKESPHKDKREKRKAEESRSKHKSESHHKKPKLENERSSSESKERHDRHSKPSTSKSKSSVKKEIKEEKIDPVELNHLNGNAGPSFEEALGGLDSVSSLKKSKEKKKSKKDKNSSAPRTSSPSTKTSRASLLPRSEDLASLLDQPALTYRPLPSVPVKSAKPQLSDSNMFSFSDVIKNKNQRTKVYSGTKSALTGVPSLLEICQKILLENIEAIEHVGSAPFEVLEPIFSKANAVQLQRIENHNPQFYAEFDELWKALVETEFKTAIKQEDECWSDVYERSFIERETKMSQLAAKIKANTEARQAPQRKTMLAFEHSLAKPPRTIRKQQIKNGTANGSLPRSVHRSDYSEAGPSGLASSRESTLARTVGLLREGPSTAIKSKKRPAPLMQKTLKFFKTNFRR